MKKYILINNSNNKPHGKAVTGHPARIERNNAPTAPAGYTYAEDKSSNAVDYDPSAQVAELKLVDGVWGKVVRDMTQVSRVEAALAQADADYASSIAQGVEINGITLGATEADQAAFTKLLTLLRESQDLQPDQTAVDAFLASSQTITDIDGAPHTLTIPQLRGLIVQYGQTVSALWGANAAKKSAIKAATTNEELDAAIAL